MLMYQIGMTTHFLLAFLHNEDTPHLYYEEIWHVCCHPLWIIVHPEPFKLELAIQMFPNKYGVAETCHFQLLKAEVILSIHRSIKNNHTFFETVNCLNIKSNQIKSNQIKYILFIYPQITITLSQWALQSLYWTTSSVLRPSFQVRKNFIKKTGEKTDGRNIRKSHRGGIPLPWRTDMQ